MPAPPKQLTQARVLTAVLINLLATPGLGSLMCRRRIAGIGQLALAVSGFCLLVPWILLASYDRGMQMINDSPPAGPPGWLWKLGVIFFGGGWLWSLATSVSLFRQARTEAWREAEKIPPKITGWPS
jgi:hypothetical protein